jgi:hypothetical protein
MVYKYGCSDLGRSECDNLGLITFAPRPPHVLDSVQGLARPPRSRYSGEPHIKSDQVHYDGLYSECAMSFCFGLALPILTTVDGNRDACLLASTL